MAFAIVVPSQLLNCFKWHALHFFAPTYEGEGESGRARPAGASRRTRAIADQKDFMNRAPFVPIRRPRRSGRGCRCRTGQGRRWRTRPTRGTPRARPPARRRRTSRRGGSARRAATGSRTPPSGLARGACSGRWSFSSGVPTPEAVAEDPALGRDLAHRMLVVGQPDQRLTQPGDGFPAGPDRLFAL